MSCQDNRDNSSVNSGAFNRRRILLASTTLGVASALGSLAHVQLTNAEPGKGFAGPMNMVANALRVRSIVTSG